MTTIEQLAAFGHFIIRSIDREASAFRSCPSRGRIMHGGDMSRRPSNPSIWPRQSTCSATSIYNTPAIGTATRRSRGKEYANRIPIAAGFSMHCLMHCYGYSGDDYKRWFDSHRPSARRYHDAIVGERGFREIRLLSEVLPGDILAMKYMNRTDTTGHIMLVADRPRRIAPEEPVVAQTEQWEVPVIDSSHSGHGPTDTRHGRGPNGKDHDGLGSGVFRIYSDPEGRVAGFSWSASRASKFVEPDDEHLVIGRYIPGFKP